MMTTMGLTTSVIVLALALCMLVRSHGQACPAGKRCNAHVDASKGAHYLMVGNPGVGKSTILNGFAGKSLFNSGPSFGGGKTKLLQRETVGTNTFMDTPGLADIELRKQAAAAITAALNEGGVYKILFVITLEAGRVKPADRTTMELVLQSAPITHYGVIINKLEHEELEMLMQNTDQARDKVQAGLMNGLPTPSLYFHFCERKKELAGKTDEAMLLDEDLARFIHNVPALEIQAGEAKDIKTDDFEAMTEKFEKIIEEMQRDKQLLQQKMDEDRAMYTEMVEEMQQRNDELQRQFQEAQNRGGGGGDALGQILGAVAPLIPAVMGAMMR